jgi:signal peptidase I
MRFEEILVILTVVSGTICLLNYLYRKLKPAQGVTAKTNVIVEYSQSFFPVFVIVLLLRSFLFEPFRIPTGSMKPTLVEGDFILVNKFAYGVRLPVLGTKLIPFGTPKVGDIIVFRHDDEKDLIKRVVGVPGDHIKYSDKKLYINGVEVPTNFYQPVFADNRPMLESTEHLANLVHNIYVDPNNVDYYPYSDVIVPPNSYFVLGDNRDNSKDGRYWGFVKDKDLLGKALITWMSWDQENKDVRWSRIGKYMYSYNRDES